MFVFRGDRYDALRACIGESLCLKLHKLQVFMVSGHHKRKLQLNIILKLQMLFFVPYPVFFLYNVENKINLN